MDYGGGMIDTKEEHERMLQMGVDAVGQPFHFHCGAPDFISLMETIEALREVARAAKPAVVRLQLLQAAGPLGKSPKWTQDIVDAIDALPDWLLEK
jgi:diaminopimelate decarboxylase